MKLQVHRILWTLIERAYVKFEFKLSCGVAKNYETKILKNKLFYSYIIFKSL